MRTARLAALGVLMFIAAAVPRPAGAFTTKTFGAGPFRYVVQTGFVASGSTDAFSVNCPTGFHATGAGAKVFVPPPSQSPGNVWVASAEPSVTHVDVAALDVTGDGEQFNGTAVCLADAGSSLTYPSATQTTSTNGDVIKLVAQCAGGKQLIGGGGSASHPDETLDVASFPLPFSALQSQIGWHYDVTHFGTTSTTMLARAVCIPVNTRTIKHVFTEAVLDEGAEKTVRVKCPGAFHVAAGGPQVDFGDLIASAPFDGGDADKAPDDGWSATVRNRTDTAEVLRVRAVCVE